MASAKRQVRMVQGAELTVRWLDDLGDVLERGDRPDVGAISDFARTLVDYQLPGIARHARRVAELLLSNEPIEDAVVAMQLLSKAMLKRDSLPENVQIELDSAVGVPYKTADLPPELEQGGHWSVLGQILAEEDRLKVIKTYVVNQNSGALGMNLAYFPPGAKIENPFRTGTAFEGTGKFYPGIQMLRVALSPRAPSRFLLPSGVNIAEMNRSFANLLGQIPWLAEMPVLLHEVTVIRGTYQLGILDASGAVPLADESEAYRMLAITGNQPMRLFGIWNGVVFAPVATGIEQDWRSIH